MSKQGLNIKQNEAETVRGGKTPWLRAAHAPCCVCVQPWRAMDPVMLRQHTFIPEKQLKQSNWNNCASDRQCPDLFLGLPWSIQLLAVAKIASVSDGQIIHSAIRELPQLASPAKRSDFGIDPPGTNPSLSLFFFFWQLLATGYWQRDLGVT